jgi:integrase
MATATKPRRAWLERSIYRQPNGRLAVCARHAGRLHFRTCDGDHEAARRAREELVAGLAAGRVPASPRLRLDSVAARWSRRFEAMVAAGERHRRTYEAHRFHLDHDLLPRLGHRRISSLTVDDVADLIGDLRAAGPSPKTTANALATLQSVLRFARRRGWIAVDPVELLEPEERPRPPRRPRGRVLGREELGRLLDCCPPAGRLQVETALYTGLRISELLGPIWADVDLDAGLIRVRAQLSRAHRDEPAQRVPPKTPASVREVPLLPQLADRLVAHRRTTPFASATDWVFATSRGTPYGARNVARRVLRKAADDAGLNDGEGTAVRFHDLRHTFASHLIVDLGLDVAQVSRILGHARITITLDAYTHLFDDARHAGEIRRQMETSEFAALLESDASAQEGLVVELRSGGRDNVRTSG